MSRTLLVVWIFLLGMTVVAQGQDKLWGVTAEGGQFGTGAIIRMNADGTGLEATHSFYSVSGRTPDMTQLVEGSDGKLYGMTNQGGRYLRGVIFSFSTSTQEYTVLHDFDGPNTGAYPSGSLVYGNDGALYGMTAYGGTSDLGIIFKYDTQSATFTKLFDFDGTNGSAPLGDLSLAEDHSFYGITYWGGASNYGVLFRYDPTKQEFQKKKDFDGTTGINPVGKLALASDGKFYGMCFKGGSSSKGTIYEYDSVTNVLTKRFDFTGSATGDGPLGYLIQATDGLLYGLTLQGGTSGHGVLFKFNPTDGSFAKQVDFSSSTKGRSPYGSLLEAANGKMYGVTELGLTGSGALFEFDPTTGDFKAMSPLDPVANSSGSSSRTTPIQASNGKIYGVSRSGGFGNGGTLFSYNPLSQEYRIQVHFNHTFDGVRPTGTLVQGANGKLYGTTNRGGANNDGTIFEYDTYHRTYTKKIDLITATGRRPESGMMRAESGKLYGLAVSGGANGNGVLFEYDPTANSYTNKFDFVSDAKSPRGVLVEANDNILYGVTVSGGINSNGTLFSFDPNSDLFNKLIEFDGTVTGSSPAGTLHRHNHILFGLAANGGANNFGTLYAYDMESKEFGVLNDFDGANDGASPVGSLIEGENNKLYGVTFSGGAFNSGTIFEFDMSDSTFTTLHNFSDVLDQGDDVVASLVLSTNGKLYGTTNFGGITDNFGVLYEFDLLTKTFTKLYDFTGDNGARPRDGPLLLVSMQEQSITFDPLPSKASLDPPFALTGTASSGLPITYLSSDTDIAHVDGDLLTINNAGTVTITATQEGNIYYYPAEPVSRDLYIELTVSAEVPSSKTKHPYPNPANSFLFIDIENLTADKNKIDVYDQVGRKFSVQIEWVENNLYKCDTSRLGSGLHLGVLPDGNRVSFIVQH